MESSFVTSSTPLAKSYVFLDEYEREDEKSPRNTVQDILRTLMEYDPEILEITEPALELSEEYLSKEILTPKFRDDALHIALASLANVDVLVSWNFKHIVHYDKIRLFNAVNIENGLKTIDIYSPREVTNYEE